MFQGHSESGEIVDGKQSLRAQGCNNVVLSPVKLPHHQGNKVFPAMLEVARECIGEGGD